jgi:hypothetical protein
VASSSQAVGGVSRRRRMSALSSESESGVGVAVCCESGRIAHGPSCSRSPTRSHKSTGEERPRDGAWPQTQTRPPHFRPISPILTRKASSYLMYNRDP